jgi:hypothetical protein
MRAGLNQSALFPVQDPTDGVERYSTLAAIVDFLELDINDIYSLIDGSRAYTGPVAGVTPTLGAHLVTKAYVDAIGGGAGGGSTHLVFDDLTPNLTETGTSWTLAKTPTADGDVSLFLNGMKLRQVASSPAILEYTISGNSITTGRSLVAGEALEAYYRSTVTGGLPKFDDLTPLLTETGTAWTLTETPASDEDVALFLNGQRLTRVAAAPGNTEFEWTEVEEGCQ